MLQGVWADLTAGCLIEIRLSPAKDHYAAPLGVQHARGASGEALQEFRKVARLGRVDCKFHQFFGILAQRAHGFTRAAAAGE